MHAVEEGVTQGEVLARGEVHGQRIEGLFVLPPPAVADPALVVEQQSLPAQRESATRALPAQPGLVEFDTARIDDLRPFAAAIRAAVVVAAGGDGFGFQQAVPAVAGGEAQSRAQAQGGRVGAQGEGIVVDPFVTQARVPFEGCAMRLFSMDRKRRATKQQHACGETCRGNRSRAGHWDPFRWNAGAGSARRTPRALTQVKPAARDRQLADRN